MAATAAVSVDDVTILSIIEKQERRAIALFITTGVPRSRSGPKCFQALMERACACRAIGTCMSVEGGMRDSSNLPLTVNFSEGLPPARHKT